MKTVQINIYKNRKIEAVIIEIPETVSNNPNAIMILASGALTPEQQSSNWDWEFVHNN